VHRHARQKRLFLLPLLLLPPPLSQKHCRYAVNKSLRKMSTIHAHVHVRVPIDDEADLGLCLLLLDCGVIEELSASCHMGGQGLGWDG